MKILVIGNGFDKAHGLKTGYVDFLNWVNKIKEFDAAYYYGDKGRHYTSDESYSMMDFQIDNPEEYAVIIVTQHNFWFSHFEKVKREIGDNWLDFESEIEKVSKRLYSEIMENGEDRIESYLERECDGKVLIPHDNNLSMAFDWLEKELNDLTRALEIYLAAFVNGSLTKDARIELFTEIKPNRLLSFNYTTTYSDIYNFGITTDYIHGKAALKHKEDECRLVLGFDDHYLETTDTVYELIPFEKYYQRIVKRNSNNYFNWVEQRNKSGEVEEKIVYFYGHSMSPADGDIIKLLIESENTKTVIFYRKDHEEDRASMIKNLAIILTPNGLIRRVGGTNPTIEFRPV